MKKTEVIVPWEKGLHARPASILVTLARSFRSSISINACEKVADAKSILSLLLLCATMGTLLEVEAVGEDELLAMSAIQQLFEDSSLLDEGPSRKQGVEAGEYNWQSDSKQA